MTLCQAQIPKSFFFFCFRQNFEVSPKSFTSLVKCAAAAAAWEFRVVRIALRKSPFNVTFFPFHGAGMSHQTERLKFHYQGGFGLELQVKLWQHGAIMSPTIISRS